MLSRDLCEAFINSAILLFIAQWPAWKSSYSLCYIFIGLEVLDDGRCFTVYPFVKKEKEEAQTKVDNFILKIFTNSFFKSCIAITKWRRVIAKWRYWKVKPLEKEVIKKYHPLFLSSFLSCLYLVKSQTS